MSWDESTVQATRRPAPKRPPLPCSLCNGRTDLELPCIACMPARARRRKPPTRPARVKGQAPDLPVRPLGASDAVFMALQELGWCRFAPFDDDAHYQGRLF